MKKFLCLVTLVGGYLFPCCSFTAILVAVSTIALLQSIYLIELFFTEYGTSDLHMPFTPWSPGFRLQILQSARTMLKFSDI